MTYTKDNISFQSYPKHSRFRDIAGHRFGRLAVLGLHRLAGRRGSFWWCECDCGTIKSVRKDHLQRGAVVSCGCYNTDVRRASKTIHGGNETDEYNIWRGMKTRCYGVNDPAYPNYGGRGIVMCDRWLHGEKGLHGFECFFADMDKRPSKRHSIERENVNGNYEPSNCHWGTDSEQANNKRNCIYLTFRGKTQTLQEWCNELHVPRMLAYYRLRRGWTNLDEVFFAPSQRGNNMKIGYRKNAPLK